MLWHNKSPSRPANKTVGRTPEIDGDKCVHSHSLLASCRACVDICPPSALVMSDDMLGIDEASCTSCGLCQSVCPPSAIQIKRHPPVSGDKALLLCERVDADGFDTISIGCIDQIGLEQLAQFHLDGIHQLVVRTGDCATCEVSSGALLVENLATFNRLIESRKSGSAMKIIAATDVSGDLRTEGWHNEKEAIENKDRRKLFTTMLSGLANTDKATNGTDNLIALAKLQSKVDASQSPIYAFVPQIQALKCDGCDACVKICPQEALTLVKEHDFLSWYKITAGTCNGCGLCADICHMDAVTIAKTSEVVGTEILLDAFNCTTCGTPCHIPQGRNNEDGQCRICAQSGQHKKLFQVLS